MARPARIVFSGALYHLTSRGNGKRDVFLSDADRRRFLSQLVDCLKTYNVTLYAYAIMSSHYHLLARTNQPNLSRFMQTLNTSYALYARYKHGEPGHQWEARYKAKIVESDEYIVALSRYIHLNPVKTHYWLKMPTEKRIERMESYTWSSYAGYVNSDRSEDYVCYDFLKHFGRQKLVARKRYKAYVSACVMESDAGLLEILKASSYAIGTADYVEETEGMLRARRTGQIQDMDVALPRNHADYDAIDNIVAAEFGIEPEDLQLHGRRIGIAKSVAVELAARFTGERLRDIGNHYGALSPSAVTIMRKRMRQDDASIPHKLMTVLTKLEKKIEQEMR